MKIFSQGCECDGTTISICSLYSNMIVRMRKNECVLHLFNSMNKESLSS